MLGSGFASWLEYNWTGEIVMIVVIVLIVVGIIAAVKHIRQK